MAEAGGREAHGTRGAQAERIAVTFARVLRAAGVAVTVDGVATFVEALGAVGVDERWPVYWAGRATLVRRPDDIPAYDEAFAAFWLGREPTTVPAAPRARPVVFDDDGSQPGGKAAERDRPGPARVVRYSPVEVLRRKDFSAYTRAEFDEARRLMADLRLAGALRRSRRLRPAAGRRGARPDLRRTIRRAFRTGGDPVRRAFLQPAERHRKVVLLLDVSGSMEPYTRALARFAQAAVAGGRRVEAFTLGTRLTRLTRQLSSRDPDAALAAASRQVADWGGGTRLGDALRSFNDEWGIRGMARGAVIVILSDGWDRGDPDALATEMARLRRVAHRVVWANPLKATPGYAPLARGMAAALPYVDEFVDGHTLASLEQLAEVISR